MDSTYKIFWIKCKNMA